MRTWKAFCLSILLGGALAGAAVAQTPTPTANETQPQPQSSAPAANPATTVNEVLDRIIAREHDENAAIRRYTPIIETYIQDMKPDKDLGAVPVSDHYFLGQADLPKGVVNNSMLASKKKNRLGQFNPLAHVADLFSSSFVPEGFLQMVYLDTTGFDRGHYQFEYVGREFLGEVRCFVFDVTPLPKSGRGRFKGRIWAEDQGFTIVRFNGSYLPPTGPSGYNLHFDSWRMNLQPGLWLPAFIFSQEADLKDFYGNRVRFKSQTRLWGYDLKNAGHEAEFSDLTIESPTAIQDQAAAQQERIGLLAPAGSVDKVLETVVNNVEVTNNLDLQPEVHCRVLLTGTLESFSIGHTIVISRGLLDVLPDEASLATILTQELANIIVTRPSSDQWGFNDTTTVTAIEAMGRFSFRDNPDELQLASEKTLELLKNSPYKDKLPGAGLFLKQLDAFSKSLPALINPHLGNRVFMYSALIGSAPQLRPEKIDQISALPIGARIKLDPWTDRVDMLKAKPVPLLSAREKMPFAVTPFMPFLTRYQKPDANVTSAPVKTDVAKKEQPAQEQTPQQQ
ncbi:MAG: hypothetical protein LAN59_14880 [Acidobacteriia bacterium]|nr:hypothetical protein [Terriglobia bacterium]